MVAIARKAATATAPAVPVVPVVAPAAPASGKIVRLRRKVKSDAPVVIEFKPRTVHMVPPAMLAVEEGYNVRKFDAGRLEHRQLAESIRLEGVNDPLTIRMVDGKPTVVEGHLRRGACLWLASPAGGKFTVPTVPVILREDMNNDRKRTGDLAVSNSAVKFTPMEQAEVAAKMKADKFNNDAIAAHLGVTVDWVRNFLLKLWEIRGSMLADMVISNRIGGTEAILLRQTHGDRAEEIAAGALSIAERNAKYGDTPRVTKKFITKYVEESAAKAREAAQPAAQPAGDQAGEGDTSPVEPTPLVKAEAALADARAALEMAAARRKGAKGNSVKKAQRQLDEAARAVAEAEAEVSKLTPAPKPGRKGTVARSGENSERSTRDPNAPLDFALGNGGQQIYFASDRFGTTRNRKVCATMPNKALAEFTCALFNEHAEQIGAILAG